jgi:phosphoglycerate dehydrogenase-like enzyme
MSRRGPQATGGWSPRIALVPDWPEAAEAVRSAGGQVVAVEEAEGLVWVDWSGPGNLRTVLEQHPQIRWVHLPGAGIESFIDAGLIDDERVWTCSKGAHSALIAEHALALALAGLHSLQTSARATSWEHARVTTLADQPVTIIGGGGIAIALIAFLAPFHARITVVRRSPEPVPGATRTLSTDALHEALPEARLVMLALALTPQTRHIIGAPQLDLMHKRAWLVNVSRGGHVDTGALVDALERDAIAGAALDVTDPEPLPDGHRLWSLPNCIITPHSAGTSGAVMRDLIARIHDNVERFGAGEPLQGVVDPVAGY